MSQEQLQTLKKKYEKIIWNIWLETGWRESEHKVLDAELKVIGKTYVRVVQDLERLLK